MRLPIGTLKARRQEQQLPNPPEWIQKLDDWKKLSADKQTPISQVEPLPWPCLTLLLQQDDSGPESFQKQQLDYLRLNEWNDIYERYQETVDAIARQPAGSGAPRVSGTVQSGRQDESGTAANADDGQADAADSGSRGGRGTRGFNPGNTPRPGATSPYAQRTEGDGRSNALGRQPRTSNGLDTVPGQPPTVVGRGQDAQGADAAQPG